MSCLGSSKDLVNHFKKPIALTPTATRQNQFRCDTVERHVVGDRRCDHLCLKSKLFFSVVARDNRPRSHVAKFTGDRFLKLGFARFPPTFALIIVAPDDGVV